MTTGFHELEQAPTPRSTRFDGELLEVSMGPQHPSTHGVFRMNVALDGEIVRKLKPVFGYLHRNHEKIGENASYLGSMPYTDRLDYFCSMTKKANDERSQEAFDHQARVQDRRILRDRAGVVEWPECDAEKGEEGADREENSKRLFAAIDRRSQIRIPEGPAAQRSTSPITISMLPRMTMTSATVWPRHMSSRIVRLIRLGGRTR